MTDKKMAEEYADNYELMNKDLSPKSPRHIVIEVFLAGLEAGRPKWHDLRKNPLDLPTENCTVLIYTDWQGMELKTFFVDTRLFENLTFREVIAWAEIPRFEGE